MTRTGTIYPIKRLVSSLPTNDLVLFQLGEPLRAPVSAGASDAASTDQNAGAEGQVVDSKETISPLRTLPLSPYPAVVGSELCVSSAWGWEDDAGAAIPLFDSVDKASLANASTGASASASASAKEEAKKKQEEKEAVGKDDALSSRWGRARLVEYRDVTGREAKVSRARAHCTFPSRSHFELCMNTRGVSRKDSNAVLSPFHLPLSFFVTPHSRELTTSFRKWISSCSLPPHSTLPPSSVPHPTSHHPVRAEGR